MRGRHPAIRSAAIVLLACAATAALARDLPVPAGKGWQHAATGIVLRSSLAGLARTGLTDSTRSELDVAATFQDAASDTTLSVFVFHPAGGGAALWFDRARTAIETNKEWGSVTPLAPPTAFAPPGAITPTALRIAYTPARKARGTALAAIPVGEWLVTLRLTSATLDAAALDAKLSAVIASIAWPAAVRTGPDAVPVAVCPTALHFDKARQRAPDMMQALLGGTIAGMAAEKTGKEQPTASSSPAALCRDATATTLYGLYRSPAETDSYLVALGDSGRTVSVYRTFALEKRPAGYAVALNDLDGTVASYPEFEGRPGPAQVVEAVLKGSPIARTARGGKSVTLSSQLPN